MNNSQKKLVFIVSLMLVIGIAIPTVFILTNKKTDTQTVSQSKADTTNDDN